MLPARSQLDTLYGSPHPVDGWPEEAKFMMFAVVPPELYARGWPKHIYCHREMHQALEFALSAVVIRGLADQLKTFDGCFCIRATRGQTYASVHSWGLAIDINAATNQLGTAGDISDELAACFTDQGFVWGKTFHRQDPMHFQFVNEAA